MANLLPSCDTEIAYRHIWQHMKTLLELGVWHPDVVLKGYEYACLAVPYYVKSEPALSEIEIRENAVYLLKQAVIALNISPEQVKAPVA